VRGNVLTVDLDGARVIRAHIVSRNSVCGTE
jgi:hypothetical protein